MMQAWLSELAAAGAPEEVTGLHLSRRELGPAVSAPWREIGGLEPFVSLEYLDLSGHALHSLAGLPALPLLRDLVLEQNEIQSLEACPELPALERLNLNLNEVTALCRLPLPRLHTLELSHNQIGSLRGWEGLPALQVLSLTGNAPLQDTADLALSPNLRELYLVRCPLRAWAGLEGLTHLQRLSATVLAQQGWDSLAALPVLHRLDLWLHRDLLHWNPGELRHCETLHLHAPARAAVGALTGWSRLKRVRLTGPGFQEVEMLRGCERLERLEIQGFLPRSPEPLRTCGRLREVFFLRTELPAGFLEAWEKALPGCVVQADQAAEP